MPKGPVPSRLRKQAQDARNGLVRFGEMYALVQRAKKVGVNPIQVLGCNPACGDLTEEQMDMVRKAVEAAELAAK